MRSVICVHERFDAIWPFTADYWHKRWQGAGGCELFRSEDPRARAPGMVPDPSTVRRLVLLGLPADADDLEPFTGLEECYHDPIGQSAAGLDGANVEALALHLTGTVVPLSSGTLALLEMPERWAGTPGVCARLRRRITPEEASDQISGQIDRR